MDGWVWVVAVWRECGGAGTTDRRNGMKGKRLHLFVTPERTEHKKRRNVSYFRFPRKKVMRMKTRKKKSN